MKRIPFKCKFGHIAIVSFEDNKEKPSTIICETCRLIGKTEIRIFVPKDDYRGNSEYLHISPVLVGERKLEIAVRY